MSSISIITGLLAMFGWGVGNFLETKPIKEYGSIVIMYIQHALNLFFFGTASIVLWYLGFITITLNNFLILLVVGIIQFTGIRFFMKGIEVGEVSLVAPIAASGIIVTIVLSVLFLGEVLSLLQVICIVCAIIGIVFVSTDITKIKDIHSAKGIYHAIVASLSFGTSLFFIGFLSKSMDFLSLGMFSRIITSFFVFCYVLYVKGSLSKKERSSSLIAYFVLITGIFAVAWFGFQYGFKYGNVSLVGPLGALNPAITVILAVIFYKEKLLWNQKLGIITILAAVVCLNLL